MPMSPERKAKRERARAAFMEHGAKPTGKVSTGLGAATYAQDFSREQRSAVMDELLREREAHLATH